MILEAWMALTVERRWATFFLTRFENLTASTLERHCLQSSQKGKQGQVRSVQAHKGNL